MAEHGQILVLGLGNRLMMDDAAGPIALERLASCTLNGATLRDGGTMGMNLLPEIEDAAALIVVDAASFNAEPGVVRVFEGAEMDRQLGGAKRTAHEVALSDLMSAAALQGLAPMRRALVAVQPETIAWGLEPTPRVAAAIPEMVAAVVALTNDWRAS
ncbi:MAG: hydrogenase maturation protease [Hyphomonadaceae bacterium]